MESDQLVGRVAAVVLAGGQGTRLFPLTQHRCKPAVGFGGRYRLIDIPLSNALHSKIGRLYVISQYFASMLHHHILATYRSDLLQNGKIELLCPEESPYKKVWFEGTADAIRQNMHHLLKSSADYFLILSGDQLYNIDFRKMLAFAEKTKADLVVASIHVPKEEAVRMGIMKTDASGHIQQFIEKTKDPLVLGQFQGPKGFLASMGIYVFSREALIKLMEEDGADFGHHLIPLQVKKGKSYAFVYDGYWVDIGTIASFYEANMALLDQKNCLDTYDEAKAIFSCPHNLPSPIFHSAVIRNSLISQGAIIEGCEISKSVIGIRSRIKKGTVIRDSIVMGNHFYQPPLHQTPPLPQELSIGENCLIQKAIIDEHVFIGNNVRLLNEKKVSKWDGDGVYIRDGIIIVSSGTALPDHFTI